ncbi:hypothetical protein HZF08_01910 [Paenibacillus sp. CGMCC 1.16610]|uniref:Uncharacterized protein n=1 Tax=Paenibacillus anseongense TaxID=2682845 RepID=A0ABW9U052_9BACL|nr:MULTISPECIES: hypothetical protein [Paenibacillus]MBA2937055.1 hypothetical protein [Paenibacillus sp. CGMCC 1.16610]MVQ33378.1 hypothetical protein [Paenibacillus anseongense]
MAQFQVTQTLKTDNAFIIQGFLLEGQIDKEMEIHIPLNKFLDVTGVITEISETNSQYNITIGCSDLEEIDLWDMLNLKDDVIQIK